MSILPENYETSRIQFKALYEKVLVHWPKAEYRSIPICCETITAKDAKSEPFANSKPSHFTEMVPNIPLTMDVIIADAPKPKQQLVILTGVHGVEGYLGSGLMNIFVEQILPNLNPQNVGICLVHAVNPQGMASFSRNTAENIDLNRNFILDWTSLPENSDYDDLQTFLEPQGPVTSSFLHTLQFTLRTLGLIVHYGADKLKRATMAGQFNHPDGVYYGGGSPHPSDTALLSLLKELFDKPYRNLLLLDLHTGYGPKNRMTIVNSSFDKRDTSTLKSALGYDLITKTASNDFYVIYGDLIDYIYKKLVGRFQGDSFYATCLEFGTGGDSTANLLHSLRLTIDMNQLKRFGAKNLAAEAVVHKGFRKLFLPDDPQWETSAINDFRKVMDGLLLMMGFTTTN